MTPARPPRGFILLPVVITLTLLAAITYMLGRDAGMNTNIAARGFQADGARYVAEAGLARMNYKAQTSNCTGYGSLNNVAFGADSYSASSTPAAGSPVTLQATAITADGATATLTRSNVVVRQSTPYVMAITPGAAGMDTSIDSSHTNFNYGAAGTLSVKDGQYHALLQFNLSAIPAGARFQSAQLELYSEGSSSNSGETVTAYRVTRAWTEGTGPDSGSNTGDGATWREYNGSSQWTTNGGDFDGASGIASPFVVSGWNAFDVTAFVEGWLAGTHPNYGVLLKGSAGISLAMFVSGENATVSRRPKLTVTFYPPCGWTPPLTSVTLTPSADGQINGNSSTTNYGSSATMQGYESGDRRSLVRFNMSSIAAGTNISSATFRVYVNSISARSGSSMLLQARALTQSWSESQFTWNRRTSTNNWSTAGGDMAGTDAATLTLPPSFNSGWIEFNITPLAQAWVDGVTANNGVIFGTTAPDQFTFATKEGSASTAPQLVVTY